MIDCPDSHGSDEVPISSASRMTLLAELEVFEHLLFEPMIQSNLDDLNALYGQWVERLGDSPEAIALCDALDAFVEACIDDDGEGNDTIDLA